MRIAFSQRKLFDYALIAVSTAMGLYHMWMIVFGAPEAVLFRGTHLLFAMVLIFLIYRFRSKSRTWRLPLPRAGIRRRP